jgi:hypothetical protein
MPLSKGRAALKSWLFKVVWLVTERNLTARCRETDSGVSMRTEALAWRRASDTSKRKFHVNNVLGLILIAGLFPFPSWWA